MSTSKKFLISGPDGRELGEGSGTTEAEALLELHQRAGLGSAVKLNKACDGLVFSPQARRQSPGFLLVNVADCTFEKLA